MGALLLSQGDGRSKKVGEFNLACEQVTFHGRFNVIQRNTFEYSFLLLKVKLFAGTDKDTNGNVYATEFHLWEWVRPLCTTATLHPRSPDRPIWTSTASPREARVLTATQAGDVVAVIVHNNS